MKQLLHTLPSLHTAIAGLPAPGMTSRELDSYVRAIERKAKLADFHLRVLEGIKWREVGGVGRSTASGGRVPLTVNLDDVQLAFDHPEAVVDYLYLAFDGLTAAVVNMTDTLARLVNRAHSLGFNRSKVNLFTIQGKCTPVSALGGVLWDLRHTSWQSAVRELRGECQHAAIEDTLVHASAPYARSGEPVVLQKYCWNTPQMDIPIVAYSRESTGAAEETMVASIAAIAKSPQNPFA